MFRKTLQPKNLVKITLAALLAVTLSGAYNLFCCQQIVLAQGAPEHCPLSQTVKSKHCNFSKDIAAQSAQAAKGAKAFECCALKFNFFIGKLEKTEFSKKAPAALSRPTNPTLVVKATNSAALNDFSYRPRIAEKRDLHVKNCIFRI